VWNGENKATQMSYTSSIWKMKKLTIAHAIPLSQQSDFAGCYADCNHCWLTLRDKYTRAPEFDQLQVW